MSGGDGPQIPDDIKSRLGADAYSRVKSLVEGWRQDGLIVCEEDDFQSVRSISKTAEARRLTKYAHNARQERLIWSGIRFRELMEQGQGAEVDAARRKAHKQYGRDGLHLAEAVQSRAVHLMESELEAAGQGETEVALAMKDAFLKPSQHFRFIKADDNHDAEASACHAILEAHQPAAFVVAGSGKARDEAAYVAREVDQMTKWYEPRRHDDEARHTTVFVFVAV